MTKPVLTPVKLNRNEVRQYLKKTGYNEEIIDELHKYLKDTTINLLRLRFGKPTGIDAFRTTNVEYVIDKTSIPLCEFVYIKDHSLTMSSKTPINIVGMN
jgi:hypothetical protein